jgi:hypothetical protein
MQERPTEFALLTRTTLVGPSSLPRSDLTPKPESERIEFLLRRDGLEATCAWVGRTLTMYRKELSRPGSYARDATYRPRFERAVREFDDWLAVVMPQAESFRDGGAPDSLSSRSCINGSRATILRIASSRTSITVVGSTR